MRKKEMIIRAITLGDQLSFSVANFILSIIFARFYSEVELAAYVMGLSIALTIQGIQRNCYIVQNAILSPPVLRRRASAVIGQQIIIWVGLLAAQSFVTLAVFQITDNVFYHQIAVSTIICTLIYMALEFDRIMMIKHEQYLRAAGLSIAFFVLISALFFVVPMFDISFFVTMSVIALFMLVKMCILVVSVAAPNFFWGWRLVRRDFRRSFRSAFVGVAGYSGHNHIPLLVLGWSSAPPIQAAAFGAMRGLMQPLQIIARSLDLIDKNLFQKRVKEEGGILCVLKRQLVIYGMLSACVVAGTLLVGEYVIYFAYGEKYAGFSHILVGWAFIFSLLAITLPLETVLVKLGRLNKYNYYRIGAGIIGTLLSFALWEDYGAMGSVLACMAGWVVSVMCAVYLIYDGLKGHDNAKR